MSIEYKVGFCKIKDKDNNIQVIYPFTVAKAVRIPLKITDTETVNEEYVTLEDILGKMKGAAFVDVNELIDPTSSVSEGTASTNRTYSMKALNQGFTEVKQSISDVKKTVEGLKDNSETLTELKNSNTSLQKEVLELTNKLSEANKMINSLNSTIDTLSTNLLSTDTKLTETRKLYTELENRVGILESTVSTLKK